MLLMELEGKPDLEEAFSRVEAWFNHEKLDRPLVRFSEHNAEFASSRPLDGYNWPDLKARWFDAEFQVDQFMESIRGRTFHGETFPMFFPNLGPNVYAAFHGLELEFGGVTSWIRHVVRDWDDLNRLKFSWENEYFQGLENLTRVALEKCSGKFWVGYTDLHGSLDCVADWRDPQQLCLDIFDNPEKVHAMLRLANENFLPVFDHYDDVLKAHSLPSITWMGIPSRGKVHIASCDFTALTSTETFCEFYFPSLQNEVRHMTHNIFHVDGVGVLNHLDHILSVPQIHAIQWVQGVGDDLPIMQWLHVIKRIQAAGKGVIVDLQLSELEPFIAAMKPDGLYLCIAAEENIQPDILKRLTKW
ncbi:MAG TPA: hypothetical protein VKO18_01005 [Terriglobia bacterium]|nr:hypothetical protein [Terriglobia bacterium]